MAVWTSFRIKCRSCGYSNRPHQSPRQGIRMALTGQLRPCRSCGKDLKVVRISDRPLARQVYAELIAEGITPKCKIVDRQTGKEVTL